ncbi:hypothetical protein WJX79_006914 [Trebouxia sp. C0005]
MFGRGSLFHMLGDDFLRDPFFQDPLNHLFGNTAFLDPSQQMAPWSSAALPQRRGREVPIESSSHRSGTGVSVQPGFSIEEVKDNDHSPSNGVAPIVEEPAEGCRNVRRHTNAREAAHSSAFMHPLQSFFNDSAFGDSNLFGSANEGNMVFYSSSVVAQQGPDGAQYAQSQSSSYGGQGVAEHQMRMKDGRTGREEMTISRHIGNKGRTVTKQRQADGRQSQQQHLHNITEDDADHFDEVWTYEAERTLPMYMRNNRAALPQASRTNRPPVVGW